MRAVLVAVAILLTGCTRLIDAQPVKEPQRDIDCNLIFPAPSAS